MKIKIVIVALVLSALALALTGCFQDCHPEYRRGYYNGYQDGYQEGYQKGKHEGAMAECKAWADLLCYTILPELGYPSCSPSVLADLRRSCENGTISGLSVPKDLLKSRGRGAIQP